MLKFFRTIRKKLIEQDPMRPGRIETAIVINKISEPAVQQMFFEATQKTRNYLALYDEIVNP